MKQKLPVVFFDGPCILCNSFIQWILLRDRKKILHFASNQSQFAHDALKRYEISNDPNGTIVYIDERGVYFRSDAVLKIMRQLGLPYAILSIGFLIPRLLRDAIYRWIARNRYQWFGKQDHCLLASSDHRARFLDANEYTKHNTLASENEESEIQPASFFALDFLIVYFLLYIFPFPAGTIPFLDRLAHLHEIGLQKLSSLVAFQFFGKEISVDFTGSGDMTHNYVRVALLILLALVIIGVFSLLEIRKMFVSNVRSWLELLTRFYLAYFMLNYGIAKVIPPLQMGEPNPFSLIQNFGDASPMGLLWRFMGASTTYQMFAGTAEVLSGVMLLFRHTSIIGSLLTAAVMTNVVALNFCFDVPVKLHTLHLFGLALFLLLPHIPKIAALTIFNIQVRTARATTIVMNKPWKNRTLRIFCFLLGLLFVLEPVIRQIDSEEASTYSKIHGFFKVDSFVYGGVADRALEDHLRWVRVGIDSYGRLRAVLADGTNLALHLSPDTERQTNKVFGLKEPSELSHTMPETGTLVMKGFLNGSPVSIRMRKEKNQPLLLSRGFRWISEEPFNK